MRKRLPEEREGPLQMLFRGQNILGYNHYADDVVEYFVQKSIANGIDIIWIFDCLNDLRNLRTAVNAAKKEGGHVQIALSYTLGEAYDLKYWETLAGRIEEMGADSLCIKDRWRNSLKKARHGRSSRKTHFPMRCSRRLLKNSSSTEEPSRPVFPPWRWTKRIKRIRFRSKE